jgi:serine/threonine protein kinase
MKVTLTVLKGPEVGRIWEFSQPGSFIVGRAADAHYRLPEDDPYVGRRQVFLEICPPRCRLRDLGRTNPTHINTEPFTEREIADGDVIEVGYTQLKVSLHTELHVEILKCKGCGRDIERLNGEPGWDRCPACLQAKDKAAPPAPVTWEARCHECSADLSAQANSDGRAAALFGVAIYACAKHIPRGDAYAGRTIGEYELRRALGIGGFGTVYLAYDPRTARVVAVKTIRDITIPGLIRRFEREIGEHRRLTHENVLRFIDMGVEGGNAPFLVTEFASEGSLEDLVGARGGRLPQTDAVSFVANSLRGLEYIHAQGVVHRDIKPSNILLRRHAVRGSTVLTPKLADFGLVLPFARAGGTRLTQVAPLGTLMYMPPEQVGDPHKAREPADTYSMGITLYYLMTGAFTFNFPSPAEVEAFRRQAHGGLKNLDEVLQALMEHKRINHPFQIILSDKPIPVRDRDNSIPTKLAGVVDKAVRKDPNARYKTAGEFREALLGAVR